MTSSKDKKIIIKISCTGAGGSTICNVAIGEKLQVQNNNIILDSSVDQTNSFEIGTKIHSTTLFPQFKDKEDVRIYDLPGLEDSRGTFFSLVNAVLIRNILLHATSVRIIFVVSQDQILVARGSGFSHMIKLIGSLVPKNNLKEMSGLIITRKIGTENFEEYLSWLSDKIENNSLLKIWMETKQIAVMSFGILKEKELSNIQRIFLFPESAVVKKVNSTIMLTDLEKIALTNFYHQEFLNLANHVIFDIEKQINESKITMYELQVLKQQQVVMFSQNVIHLLSKRNSILHVLGEVTEDLYQKVKKEFYLILEKETKRLDSLCFLRISQLEAMEAEERARKEQEQHREAQEKLNQEQWRLDREKQRLERIEAEKKRFVQEVENVRLQIKERLLVDELSKIIVSIYYEVPFSRLDLPRWVELKKELSQAGYKFNTMIIPGVIRTGRTIAYK